MISYKTQGRKRRPNAIRFTISLPLILLLLLVQDQFHLSSSTLIPCTTDKECQTTFLPNSHCSRREEGGVCTNPFTVGGCLHNLLPEKNKRGRPNRSSRLRVCNSEDPPDAPERGLCRTPNPGFEHTEIRIFAQNWESGFVLSWLLQILLSELLDVPTTIETGLPGKNVNFYDPFSNMDYGLSNDWEAFRTANRLQGDCSLANTTTDDPDHYEACAHIVPEVWEARLKHVRKVNLEERVPTFEPPLHLGMLGDIGWFIPRWSGTQDPTLLTYLGLQGEENRRKLAETFLFPATFAEYCRTVHDNNCTMANAVAQRPPQNDEENEMYFLEGVYTGHFRKTEENDCDKYPTSCRGHLADFPCTWASLTKQQIEHLQISLNATKQYTSQQLMEMYRAANATRSNIIIQWWTPDILASEFAGSDFEFYKVRLPLPTQECINYRVNVSAEVRCSDKYELLVGDPRGACDMEAQSLSKVLASSVYDEVHHAEIPEARRSPAHDAIHLFTVTALQLQEIFDYARSVDNLDYDPRHATCKWFVENIDVVQNTFVPRTYPRVLREVEVINPLFYVAVTMSWISFAAVVFCIIITYRKRESKPIRYAQIEFLWILLLGLLLISVTSILTSISSSSPTDGTCVSSIWLTNLGFTLELVPLIVKVAALNHLMKAAIRMQRVKLARNRLYAVVFLQTSVMVVFLTCWTVLDPPTKEAEHQLSTDMTDSGETVVTVSYRCAWGDGPWRFVALGVVFIYLIVATVLAVQTHNLQQEFNETSSLAIMIYSHFIFAVLRFVSFLLEDNNNMQSSSSAWFQSIILSCDVFATVCIYFMPKFVNVPANLPRISNHSFFGGSTDARPSFPQDAQPAPHARRRSMFMSIFQSDADAMSSSSDENSDHKHNESHVCTDDGITNLFGLVDMAGTVLVPNEVEGSNTEVCAACGQCMPHTDISSLNGAGLGNISATPLLHNDHVEKQTEDDTDSSETPKGETRERPRDETRETPAIPMGGPRKRRVKSLSSPPDLGSEAFSTTDGIEC